MKYIPFYRQWICCLLIPILAIMLLASCRPRILKPSGHIALEPVAFSDDQWTGLAIARDGRLFVNYPRWSDHVRTSVAELVDGKPISFPNDAMNAWEPGKDPATHLICVQALYVDDKNRLWILDPANPKFRGVIPGGPKLLQVDLATDTVVGTFHFDSKIAFENSYLNDVRIDTSRDYAYITDSGNGALIVLDLKTGKARRLLDNHPSTDSEEVTLTIAGKPWMLNGARPSVHSDGIAYDPRMDVVYYQALTGRTLYRIPAASLRRPGLAEKAVQDKVETVGKTGAADGLIFGKDNMVYISAIEKDAIRRTTPDGRVETLVQHKAIVWPDSFSLGPDGKLYFTTSRIHEGATPENQYGIYRITIPK